MTKEEKDLVFGGINELYKLSQKLYEDLAKRQKESNFLIQNIGDILLNFIPLMGPFSKYCIDQYNASNAFSQKMANDVKFAVAVKVYK